MDHKALEQAAQDHLNYLKLHSVEFGASYIYFQRLLALIPQLSSNMNELNKINPAGALILWQLLEHHRPTQD